MGGDIGLLIDGEIGAEDQAHQGEEDRGGDHDLGAMFQHFGPEVAARDACRQKLRDHAHGGREEIPVVALHELREAFSIRDHEADHLAPAAVAGAAAVHKAQKSPELFRAGSLRHREHGASVSEHVPRVMVDHFLEQALLRFEIEIDRALGHPGPRRDVLHARRREAALGEGVERRFDDFARSFRLAARALFHFRSHPAFQVIDFPVSQ